MSKKKIKDRGVVIKITPKKFVRHLIGCRCKDCFEKILKEEAVNNP